MNTQARPRTGAAGRHAQAAAPHQQAPGQLLQGTAPQPQGPARHLAVVGSGVAGLYAAITAVEHGHRVTLLTKDALADSNSWYAQGGIAAVGPGGVAAGDSVASHIANTLTAGARLNAAAAVRELCASAWGHIERLAELGTGFDTVPDGGAYGLGLEAAHSHPRILHAGGDATGKAIASALILRCRELATEGRMVLQEQAFVTSLLHDGDTSLHDGGPAAHVPDGAAHVLDGGAPTGRADAGASDHGGPVTGVRYLDGEAEGDGIVRELRADVVLLATGGIGSLYAWSTNPAGATGDGAALAWRAGAVVADAEFVQFHPTLVPDGNFMVSEAVRGEGAVLIDGTGRRFMQELHPDAELASRDVVARSIHRILADGGSVWLDATGVEAAHGPGFLARRFPAITARLAELGHDLALAPVPVKPAQHYWMGGVFADEHGRTTVPGLRVAGEAACTGTHGANRLASNSLLEALVHAWHVATSLATVAPESAADASTLEHVFELDKVADSPRTVDLATLRGLASRHLGVERTGQDLEEATRLLAQWAPSAEGPTRAQAELGNLLTVGRIIAEAALARRNSLGAHYRSDAAEAPEPVNGQLTRTGFVRAGVRTGAAPVGALAPTALAPAMAAAPSVVAAAAVPGPAAVAQVPAAASSAPTAPAPSGTATTTTHAQPPLQPAR